MRKDSNVYGPNKICVRWFSTPAAIIPRKQIIAIITQYVGVIALLVVDNTFTFTAHPVASPW